MPEPGRILVVQLRRIGDVVFTLPVIGALRRRFPKAQIDFLVEEPSDQLVRLNPHLNETLVYERGRPLHWALEVRRRRYDWVLDFLSNGRTLVLTTFSGAKLRAGFSGPWTRWLAYNRRAPADDRQYIVEQKLSLLKSLGVPAGNWSWDLVLPEDSKAWAEHWLKSQGWNGEQLLGLAPASRRETRRWLPERFAEVAREMKKRGKWVLYLWGPGEKEEIEAIVRQADGGPGKGLVPPETSFLELAALIGRCGSVLAVDNGPKNTAVALGVPTVTIDGPTNPLSFNPHGNARHAVVRDETLFCIGCGLNRCPYRHECMTHMTAEQALKALDALPAR